MCCSVLQCGAVCCSVLQCAVAYCSGKCSKNVRSRSDSLDDQRHGCPIVSQLEGTECASQRRAICRCDFSRIVAGKTIFLHLGPPTEASSPEIRQITLKTQGLASSWDTILIPARDASHRRGATTTRQEAGLGARGVTKTTTGTRTSKPQDSDPQAH